MDTFEMIAKKSKKRNIKRILLWSLVSIFATLAILLGIHILLGRMQTHQYFRAYEHYEHQAGIAYPNIETATHHTTPTGLYSSIFTMDRIKDLDGAKVAYEPLNIYLNSRYFYGDPNKDSFSNYSLKNREKSISYTRGNMIKVPLFFNTKVRYEKDEPQNKPSQELPLVQQMKGQLVEVALTFDKPYTYEELKTRLPDNLKKNWYWLGTSSDYDISNLGVDATYGMVLEETEPEESFKQFKEHLKKAIESGRGGVTVGAADSDGKDHTRYDSQKELQYFQKHTDSLKETKFAGVILTGKAENFAQLEGKDWIYASSIGASTPNQPYYQLDKE